ncbi:segregation and condensation protein A [Aestuariimicrobium ganziense]|uniref:segregation and condensation protein A n=1 Tax=Aestuariimicrobium ganziense TaxID=2773677 RepID=UPI001941B65E|nr:segregation/condensation protein A [Aestuariimicrobium ganziense]
MTTPAAPTDLAGEAVGGFVLRLDNFEGPFDLLLQLISRHKLDVTEVALSRVTDEFIAHVKAAGPVWDLEQTSSFLVVAATLLDLKAARLLPQGEVEDPEDLALLEARDLLFARLLQYRAFKQVSAWFAARLGEEAARMARPGGLEPQFAALMPEVTLVSPERLAEIAARALTPQPVATVALEHLHVSAVSVQEEGRWLVGQLRRLGTTTFRALVHDADVVTTVARFLALLELFRESVVAFEQLTPLGELTIRWSGDDETELTISDEFDQPVLAEEAR